MDTGIKNGCGFESISKRDHHDQVHRLNMELDLQSLFWIHVHSCTHWLRPQQLPPPRIWAHRRGLYWSAKIDDISL